MATKTTLEDKIDALTTQASGSQSFQSLSALNCLRHQPKIIVQAVEISDHHLSDPILRFARERTEILHHLFEQRTHRESISLHAVPPDFAHFAGCGSSAFTKLGEAPHSPQKASFVKNLLLIKILRTSQRKTKSNRVR
jgi:hypothetical protein